MGILSMMRRKIFRKGKSATRVKSGAKKRRLPTASNEPIEALVAASAKALGIMLEPSWEAGVAFNLQLIFSHAALVDGFSLADDTEPAPIFHA